MAERRHWFRITGDRRWDGRWHLLVRRARLQSGHRLYGAACGPVLLRQTQHGRRLVRSVASYQHEPLRSCQGCSAYLPRGRLVAIRRAVCETGCGSWVPREAVEGEPVPCSGWHRNKRLWCEADARFAIASGPSEKPFFRCTKCAASYRREARDAAERLADGKAVGPWLDLPRQWVIERLMDEPPKALVAA